MGYLFIVSTLVFFGGIYRLFVIYKNTLILKLKMAELKLVSLDNELQNFQSMQSQKNVELSNLPNIYDAVFFIVGFALVLFLFFNAKNLPGAAKSLEEKFLLSSGFKKADFIKLTDEISLPSINLEGVPSSLTIKQNLCEITYSPPLFAENGSLILPLVFSAGQVPLSLLSVLEKSEKFDLLKKNGTEFSALDLEILVSDKKMEIAHLSEEILILKAQVLKLQEPFVLAALETMSSVFG